MRLIVSLVLMGLIGLQADASAQVHRSQSGLGSALIVPYWTSAGSNDTLLSIRNDSERATVAKLHWLDDEGQLLQSLFSGEPVIGFGIQQFTNGILVDGQGQNVLANYRGTERPRRHLILIESE